MTVFHKKSFFLVYKNGVPDFFLIFFAQTLVNNFIVSVADIYGVGRRQHSSVDLQWLEH